MIAFTTMAVTHDSLPRETYRARNAPKDRQFVTALARGLRILRCFSHNQPELTPNEIVRMTGLPQPTVWRLCHTLQEAGFIICPGDGRKMALGIPALALGYATLVRQPLPQIALPYMRALTEHYRLGTSLAVRDGLDMTYLQRTHGDFTYFNDPVGARRPIATAPTGWACMATYNQTELTALYKALKRQHGKNWPATQRNIQRALADYRAHGFVLSVGILHKEFNAVAVPIRRTDTVTVHGLSASGLASIWPRARLIAIGSELIALARDLATVSVPEHLT